MIPDIKLALEEKGGSETTEDFLIEGLSTHTIIREKTCVKKDV